MVMESSPSHVLHLLREHHVPTDAYGAPLPGALGPAIKAVLAGLDVDVLTAGVPGVQVLLRELSLPFGDDKRVAPILGFQLESLLPRPLDTMVYDWHLLEKTPEGAQLLCPAADKQWLEQWLAEVRSGGAEPRHLTLSTLAQQTHAAPGSVGGRRAHTGGGRSRSPGDAGDAVEGWQGDVDPALSRGGHHVTQALARALNLVYADAEHVKHHELDLRACRGVEPAEHAPGARRGAGARARCCASSR
jgi:hypothetical protein